MQRLNVVFSFNNELLHILRKICEAIYPAVHNLVASYMIHGPCGVKDPSAPCMKNNHCEKGFPKQYISDTVANENGYPL